MASEPVLIIDPQTENTDFVQLEDQLVQAKRQLATSETVLQTLLTVGRTIAASSDMVNSLNCIVEAATRLSGADEGLIMLLGQQGELRLRAAWGTPEQLTADFKIKVKESLIGQVIRTGQPFIINRRDEYEAFKLANNYFVTCMAALPLKVSERTVGVLVVIHKSADKPFDDNRLRPLTMLADLASLVVRAGE